LQISESEARKWFIQLISALEYSYNSTGISHRDLKPENLLFDDQMNIKICDFGLCNHVQDGKSLVTSCGTPNYAAPEILMAHNYDGI
jgi:carbon catabolite-derepressing protein kinase